MVFLNNSVGRVVSSSIGFENARKPSEAVVRAVLHRASSWVVKNDPSPKTAANPKMEYIGASR